jgi:hypothetical protein
MAGLHEDGDESSNSIKAGNFFYRIRRLVEEYYFSATTVFLVGITSPDAIRNAVPSPRISQTVCLLSDQ